MRAYKITTDGFKAYFSSIDDAFGADVDYAYLVKTFGTTDPDRGTYSPSRITAILISLQKPTKEMKKEAASPGFYASPFGTSHPRIQTLTIEQLLSGAKIDYPTGSLDQTFKKPPKFKGKVAQQLPLAAEHPTKDYGPLDED